MPVANQIKEPTLFEQELKEQLNFIRSNSQSLLKKKRIGIASEYFPQAADALSIPTKLNQAPASTQGEASAQKKRIQLQLAPSGSQGDVDSITLDDFKQRGAQPPSQRLPQQMQTEQVLAPSSNAKEAGQTPQLLTSQQHAPQQTLKPGA